ncbi:M13 family metallopeptidase [Sphingomonas aracearum]|uniref:M13 family peptidase n=1 Tax=Sphingomonas aracearum TaxID=2283317 RepID=A0A369VV32_9SPHN|nr:M13 family metallopeptidase [Sphingomonas aracearum]RDE05719.1 M13 family peptidase [Sphingomonas aracearum]
MKRLALVAALIGTTALAQSATPPAPRPAGVDTTAIDTSVKAGDDFDAYANGAWRARTTIPADRASTGVFYDVFTVAEKRNAELIAGLGAAKPAAGTDARRIADYYAAYLDTAAIERRGLAPIKPELDAIAALPDKAALARMMGADLRADVDPLNATNFRTEHLFGLFVSQGLATPDRTVPYLLQGGIGMPERDYYLSQDADKVAARKAYVDYMTQAMTLAGLSDPAARAQRVMALETKIAAAHLDYVSSQDVTKANNVWRAGDFATKAPGLDWKAFFAAAQLGGQSEFIVWMPDATTRLAALVASEPLAAWKDWLAFHHINQVASVLPKGFDDASFAFYGKTLSGAQVSRPRDKRAIAATNGALGDAIGKIYVQRYFPASSKAEIQSMVKNILAAFDGRVAKLDWMAPATKAEARRKIETMRVGVGYPENWRSYASLEIRADDPVGNLQRARAAEYRHQLSKLGKAPDRGEWWMTPQTVNAVNLPLQNALNFPAAILEAPFFDPRADAASNYGSIGAVIGHEISHSFDNSGATFDSSGALRNWWTDADLARFKAQGKMLADQYSAYEPLPGAKVNGEQTLAENIADVAGLTAAYEAYHASLGGKPAPVIGGLSGDQRFFLAFAQSWREKTREAALRSQIATDGHAPGGLRAQTVRNLDAWYPAFQVQPGQKLYLAPPQRVKVW